MNNQLDFACDLSSSVLSHDVESASVVQLGRVDGQDVVVTITRNIETFLFRRDQIFASFDPEMPNANELKKCFFL